MNIMPIKIIFLCVTLPLLIYLFFPFGGVISSEYKELILISNILFYFGAYFYPLLNIIIKKKRYTYNYNKLTIVLLFLVIMSILIQLYFYYILSFNLPIFNTSLRKVLYEKTFGLWSLFITLNMTLYLIYGFLKVSKKLSNIFFILIILNTILIVGYGMKANMLQIIICFYLGKSINENYNFNLKGFFSYGNFKKLLLLLLLFWIINSARSGSLYGVIEFLAMFYLYIIPPFANFNNVLSNFTNFEGVFLGGLLQGPYKLVGVSSSPLDSISLDYLVSQTWNVWSFYANWYASGGLFEVYLSSYLIGFYIALSFIMKIKKPNFITMMNYSQMLIMCFTLHNSYYYQSVSPILSILLCLIIHIITKRKFI